MRRTTMGLAFLVALAGGGPTAPAAADEGAVKEVLTWLAGTFDSKEQAEADPKEFRAARLVVVEVPKSRIGRGAPVLYVEEALLATPNRPYRQRFYRLGEGLDGAVEWRVLEPKDRIAVSGKWRTPEDLAVFGLADVTERVGCRVTLRKKGAAWEGETTGTACPSALNGARYATSRVSLFADRLESWDRGFDESHEQVSGARTGPYTFRKRSAGPPEP